MVLSFSLWLDDTAQMLWLDGDYPPGADPTKPGVSRGPCGPDSGKREDILDEQPDASVTFSNIKIGDIGSTYSWKLDRKCCKRAGAFR
jgi:cellulose 1,4-beta-cellobiosidase